MKIRQGGVEVELAQVQPMIDQVTGQGWAGEEKCIGGTSEAVYQSILSRDRGKIHMTPPSLPRPPFPPPPSGPQGCGSDQEGAH